MGDPLRGVRVTLVLAEVYHGPRDPFRDTRDDLSPRRWEKEMLVE